MPKQIQNEIKGDEHEAKGEIKYWRSVDYKNRIEEIIRNAKEEFRPGDSEVSGLQRREMLKLMGASMALAGAGVSCRRPEEKILPYARSPEDLIPGVPNYFATARSSVNCATGLVVESHENRPTKIEGNKEHPMSLGAASSQDQAAVLELYDPDRSKHVMKLSERSLFEKSSIPEWQKFIHSKMDGFAISQGRGLAIVYPGHGSLTQERILAEIKKKMPSMQIYAYDPMIDVNTRNGAAIAFGENARVLYNFENARVVVTLHSDPFLKGTAALRNARGFAKGRTIDSAKASSEMNRLYSVEADYSVTGTNADHRIRVAACEGGDFLLAVAKELSSLVTLPEGIKDQLGSKKSEKTFEVKAVKAIANDLAKNTSKALIVVGESQEPWVHALAHALNQALSGLGATFDVVRATPTVSDAEGFEALKKLHTDLKSGEVDTLVLLDTNLAYATPGGFSFAETVKNAKSIIHAGGYMDETAKLAHWHLPLSHFLESWGDVRSFDGTGSIQQPLIEPLYESRSIVELLGDLLSKEQSKGYDLVQETWKGGLGLSEKAWRKIIHDGLLAGSQFERQSSSSLNVEAIVNELQMIKPKPSPSVENVEVILDFDRKVLDGRLANISWMQELPDPITKMTWDNALYVSPSLAKQMGLKSGVKDRYYVGDVVTLSVNGKAIDVPTFVVPGLAEYSVVATLGYGRTDAGTIGNGVGYDAYQILPMSGSRVVLGAKLSRTSKTHALASTQEQYAMNGETIQEISTLSLQNRDPARVIELSKYREEPKYTHKKALKEELRDEQGLPLQMTDPPWQYNGNKWGMVIDLTTCNGCNACVTACQAENNIPVVGKSEVMRSRAMHWIRIDRYFTGDVNSPQAIAQPVPCMHCENAPCEPVCPVAATAHDKEGLNAMTYNRCVGTRYCGNNCPYKVRKFNYLDFSHSGNLYVDAHSKERNKTLSMQMNPDVTVRYRGVMEKCTYCVQRIQEAKINATRNKQDPNALKDGAVTPACAQTCPTQAITFGNLNDKDSLVNKRKKIDRNYDLLDELNVRPRTSYLGKLRNPNPELV